MQNYYDCVQINPARCYQEVNSRYYDRFVEEDFSKSMVFRKNLKKMDIFSKFEMHFYSGSFDRKQKPVMVFSCSSQFSIVPEVLSPERTFFFAQPSLDFTAENPESAKFYYPVILN